MNAASGQFQQFEVLRPLAGAQDDPQRIRFARLALITLQPVPAG